MLELKFSLRGPLKVPAKPRSCLGSRMMGEGAVPKIGWKRYKCDACITLVTNVGDHCMLVWGTTTSSAAEPRT